MKIVAVVTASSNSGAQAVETLLLDGSVLVRAGFRSAAKAEALNKKWPDCERLQIVTGIDAAEPDTLTEIMKGADFCICVTPHFDFAKDAELSCNMCQKAADAGAHIVYVGSWTVRVPETTIAKRFVPTESFLKSLKEVPWTSLRSGYFAGNYATLFSGTDVYFPDISVPPVDPKDIGRVAAAICLDEDPQKHAYKYYDISGPENLTTSEIVKKVEKATGKSFNYHPLPVDTLQGPPPFLIELIKDIHAHPLPCSTTVMDLTKQHTHFDTYLQSHLHDFIGEKR